MANLRANRIVSTTGSNAITGSVEFDGTNDWLQISDSANLELGSSDFTIEGWVYIGNKDQNIGTIFIKRTIATNLYSPYAIAVQTGALKFWSSSNGSSWDISSASSFGTIVTGSWYHFAIVRSGSSFNGYLNGILGFSVTSSASLLDNSAPISIGAESDNSNDFIGFVSNLRVIKGTALYTSNFIPPTRKLTNLPGTVLLCCQDNESVTTEATGKTITANGNPAARRFTPSVGSDGSVEFAGPTTINTENYFYLPTGTTEQQFPIFPGGNVGGSARGLWGGGATPSIVNTIDYVTISSTGDAQDFGDLTQSRFTLGGCASATRGLFGGGYTPTQVNTIDYVTIASIGNALDFGDLTNTPRFVASLSNSTRGLWAGGYQAPTRVNTIGFITISSTGNAQDFGDLIAAKAGVAGCSSPTRGIFAGGNTPTLLNTIDYVIIQTSGIAVDFGDLTAAKAAFSACSSSTRGIFAGGQTPTNTNVIEYITISTNANAFDFGDLISANASSSGCSSSTRGLFGGGYISPANSNIIEYVTVASTGNAQDFGDLTVARRYVGALSNGHGGLG